MITVDVQYTLALHFNDDPTFSPQPQRLGFRELAGPPDGHSLTVTQGGVQRLILRV